MVLLIISAAMKRLYLLEDSWKYLYQSELYIPVIFCTLVDIM